MPQIISTWPSVPISRRKVLLGSAGLACMGLPSAVAPDTGRAAEPPPVAVADFVAGSPDAVEDAHTVSRIITSNLRRCGLLVLDAATWIKRSRAVDTPRCFAEDVFAARLLVTGSVTRRPDGRAEAEFRLWNAILGVHLGRTEHIAPQSRPRRIGHLISDAVHERLTGEKGYFDSRVVFIDETGSPDRRVTRLAMMDQDGGNLRYLTHGEELLYTPRFSPSGREIVYVAVVQSDSRVYILDVETGRRETVGNFRGTAFSPCFSPDERTLVLSVGGDDHGANLFAIDLTAKMITRLTGGSAIDTRASYAPDGQRICFESDRDGRQNIYVMNANGGTAQLIKPNGSMRRAPAWSPRGDVIAFTKLVDGRFCVGIVGLAGSRESILSEASRDDGPSFAPNGRALMFSRDPPSALATRSLVALDLTTCDEFTVPTPNSARDPDWSALL